MTWNNIGNLKGPQGPTGPASTVPGPEGPEGPEGPQGPQGSGLEIKGVSATYGDLPMSGNADGDLWITQDTGRLYVWSSGWPAEPDGVLIRGEQGPEGPQGIQGPIGLTGIQGEAGEEGPTGPAGTTTWAGITDKPLTFSPEAHAHSGADITSGTVPYARLPVGTASSTVAAGNDSRFTDTRTPTDGSVTTPKFASGVLPHDMTVVQFSDGTTRAAGLGDLTLGVCVQRAFTLKGVRYRFATADASGNTVVELRKNGTQISGTSKTVAAADQLGTSGSAREVTGLSVAVAKGDVITAYITGVGTTPGKGLYVDVEGVV